MIGYVLKGTRDAVLRRIQPISIHGQMSWEIVFTHADDPGEQLNAARVGPEAIVGQSLEPGDRIKVEYLVGVVVKVTRLADAVASQALGPGCLPGSLPCLAILIVLSSIRLIGVSPFTGAFSIASTAAIPSTTRPNAVLTVERRGRSGANEE